MDPLQHVAPMKRLRIVLAAAWLSIFESSACTRSDATEAPRSVASAEPTSPQRLGRFRLGQAHLGSIDGTFDVSVDGREMASPQYVGLRGTLRQVPVAIEGASVICAFALENLHITLPPEATSDPAALRDVSAQLTNALSRPFYVRYTEDGAAQEVLVASDIKKSVRDVWMTLVGDLQLVTPRAGFDGPVSEHDEAGAYSATYEPRGKRRVVKRKLHYLPSSTSASATIELEHFEATIELAEDGWPKQIDLHEGLRLALGGLSLRTQVELAYRNTTTEDDPSWVPRYQASRTALIHHLMGPGASSEVDRREQMARLLGSTTLPELRTELTALVDRSPEERSMQRGEAVQKLAALVYLDPDLIPQVRALIDERSEFEGLAAINALGLADTPQSADALLSCIEASSLSSNLRRAAIIQLGRLHDPPRRAISVLARLSTAHDDPLATPARLAWGALALAMREHAPHEAASIVSDLERLARRATTPAARIPWIKAIGNTGHPAVVPLLEEALDETDPELRRAAIEALRLVDHPRAIDLLRRALASASAWERQIAAQTLVFRDLEPFLADVLTMAKQDPDASVRAVAAQALGRAVEGHDEIAEELRAIAQHDPSEDVRRYANLAIGR